MSEVLQYDQTDSVRNISLKKSQDEDSIGEIEQIKQTMVKKEARKGISAEAYGVYNTKKKFHPKVIKKTDEQISRIKSKIINSFIFKNLDQNDIKIVIDAMEEKCFQ